MAFTYTPGIPAGTDIPAQSASLFAANFSYLPVVLNRDHIITKNSANPGEGTHRQVTLTNQTGPGFAGGNAALYCQNTGGDSFPKWQNTAGTKFMFAVNPQVLNNGYTGLPGTSTLGVILQWGFVTTSAPSTGKVTFNVNGISFPTACFTVITTPFYSTVLPNTVPSDKASIAIDDSAISKTSFKWSFNTNSSQYLGFYWVAIGA